jgi:hypothetical protein
MTVFPLGIPIMIGTTSQFSIGTTLWGWDWTYYWQLSDGTNSYWYYQTFYDQDWGWYIWTWGWQTGTDWYFAWNYYYDVYGSSYWYIYQSYWANADWYYNYSYWWYADGTGVHSSYSWAYF